MPFYGPLAAPDETSGAAPVPSWFSTLLAAGRAGLGQGLGPLTNPGYQVDEGGQVRGGGLFGQSPVGQAMQVGQQQGPLAGIADLVKMLLLSRGGFGRPPFSGALEGGTWSPVTQAQFHPSGIPTTVQRIEELGSVPGTVAKPQGLYTTPGHLESPHADLGGPVTRFATNPEASILSLDPSVSGRDVVMRRDAIGAGAGVHAARVLLGPDAFATLRNLPKSGLIAKARDLDPSVDWSRYFDRQEIMEGIGGTLARRAGYDALWLADREAPAFSEYVGLSPRAFTSGAGGP